MSAHVRLAIASLNAAIACLSAQRDVLLALVAVEAGEAASDEPDADEGQPPPCAHPNRLPIGTMGNPDGWLCPDCDAAGTGG